MTPLGPHLCAASHRLKSPGKLKRHYRKCATCQQLLGIEMERRLAQQGTEQPPTLVDLINKQEDERGDQDG